MKNQDIVKMVRKDYPEAKAVRTYQYPNHIVSVMSPIIDNDSVFSRTVIEVKFNNKRSADKLVNEINII